MCPAGLAVHLGGDFASTVDKQKENRRQQGATEAFSIIFIIVLLLAVFRSALAPLITLLPAAMSLVIAGPLIAEASKAGIQVSGIMQILLTVIVLGAGTDYGLFLIFRVREEIASGSDPREAVTIALSRVGETITFSAACVIFALWSLIFADFGFYRGLGPGLAIGIAVVLVAGLTLMPALLAIFGRAVFWPRQPKPGVEQTGLWGRAAARVVTHPKRTLVTGLLVFGGLALGWLAYDSAGFGANEAPAGSDAANGPADPRCPLPGRRAQPHERRLPIARVRVAQSRSRRQGPGAARPPTPVHVRPRRPGTAGQAVAARTDLDAVPQARPAAGAHVKHAAARRRSARVRRLQGDVTVHQQGRQDDPVLRRAEGRRSQRHEGAARDARDPPRRRRGCRADRRHRPRRGRPGDRRVRRQPGRQQRPPEDRPDRAACDRASARRPAAQPDRAAVPDRDRRPSAIWRRWASRSSSSWCWAASRG